MPVTASVFTKINLETHNFSFKFWHLSPKYEIVKVHGFEKYVFFEKMSKKLEISNFGYEDHFIILGT